MFYIEKTVKYGNRTMEKKRNEDVLKKNHYIKNGKK